MAKSVIPKNAATQPVAPLGGANPPALDADASGQLDAVPEIDAIRAEAYAIYERRAGAPGNSVQDWLEAEAKLRAGQHS